MPRTIFLSTEISLRDLWALPAVVVLSTYKVSQSQQGLVDLNHSIRTSTPLHLHLNSYAEVCTRAFTYAAIFILFPNMHITSDFGSFMKMFTTSFRLSNISLRASKKMKKVKYLQENVPAIYRPMYLICFSERQIYFVHCWLKKVWHHNEDTYIRVCKITYFVSSL